MFTSDVDFDIYRVLPNDDVFAKVSSGNRNQDSFSDDNSMYILKEWWDGATATDDEYFFSTERSNDMIEMPVLFEKNTHGAVALTNNVVNSVVSGSKIIMARVSEEVEVLNGYIKAAAILAGFDAASVSQVSDKSYHEKGGSLHCGSNVFRKIDDEWWQTL